jgi:hypothetical protein
MNTYAIVKNGVVVNVIEYAEQPTTPPAGFEDGHTAIQADAVNIGWVYANGTFTDPNPIEQIQVDPPKSLTEIILADATELAKLKQALGIA